MANTINHQSGVISQLNPTVPLFGKQLDVELAKKVAAYIKTVKDVFSLLSINRAWHAVAMSHEIVTAYAEAKQHFKAANARQWNGAFLFPASTRENLYFNAVCTLLKPEVMDIQKARKIAGLISIHSPEREYADNQIKHAEQHGKER